MLLTALVVDRQRFFENLADDFTGNGRRERGDVRYVLDYRFERVQRSSRVALSMGNEQLQGIVTESYLSLLASPLVFQLQRPFDHRSDVLVIQRSQHKHPAPGEEGSSKLKARVLRRRTDERDDPVLDPRQKRVLLPLVEPMDLVAEEDRPLSVILEPLFGLFDDLAHARHAFGDG